MRITWCLMYEVTMDLTNVTSISIGDVVRNQLWPIIAKPLKSVPKLGPGW